MRPVELTLEGFKSYRDPVTFSFDQRGLFGIVGPTGAGKSTILDGIVYGLYGETPRIRRSTRSLINALDDQAKVNLVWEADGRLWEVTRILKRNGQSKVILHPKGDRSDPITGESAVTAKIVDLVGLDAAAFCSSVTLPQGDFDRFLRATASERSRILKGIFRLERVDLMRAEADARSREADARIALLGESIASLPEDPDGALENLIEQTRSAEKHAQQIKAALPKIREAEKAIEAADRELEELGSKVMDAERSLSEIPDIPSLETLADRHARAAAAHQEAAELSEAAANTEASARSALASLEEELGGADWFRNVEAALTEHGRLEAELEKVVAALPVLASQTKRLAEGAEAASAALEDAERALGEAEAALHRAHMAESSAVLRKGLSQGDACPVCEQIVQTLPKPKKTPEVKAATAALQGAKKSHQEARTVADQARQDLALAEQQRADAEARSVELKSEADKASSLLRELAGDDAAQEIARRTAILKEAKEHLDAAGELRLKASQTEAVTRKDLGLVVAEVSKAVTVISRVCGSLRIEATSFEASELPGTAKLAQDAATSLRERLTEEVRSLTARVAAARVTWQEFHDRYEVPAESSVEDVYAAAVARHEDLKRDVTELTALISKAGAAREEVGDLTSKKARYERLKADLTDARFTSYLLERQRRLLSDLASEKFTQLTGHYTFDDEGDFQIVDVRTGTTRAPDTLSGGETFLASLALALALAEAVAQGGSSLDCFFLDEGFGSLDSESLDLALHGIEMLATPGRLIGLISHLPGIQQGVGDLIVLDKTSEGSTVVVQHEGPLGYEAVLI